jgi:Caspase domain
MLEGKRRAIIIGVHEYEDNKIPSLPGAENDANELFNMLSDPKIGNFTVSPDHHLLGERANNSNIRKALSDIFWQSEQNDIVIFYFAGHGFADSLENLYLAPYDMLHDEPFVHGINIEEVKNLISKSKLNKTILTILDCCHSGIAAGTMRGASDHQKAQTVFDNGIKSVESVGEGRIILASSEKDKQAREKNDCVHGDLTEPHAHGLFTFNLITGLEKKYDEIGRITLSRLSQHLAEEFQKLRGEQRPGISIHGGTLGEISIAMSPHVYLDKMQKCIAECNNACESRDIQVIKNCIALVLDLEKMSPLEGQGYRSKFNRILGEHQTLARRFYMTNLAVIRANLLKIDPNAHRRLGDTLHYYSVEKINAIGEFEFRLLLLLCDEAMQAQRDGSAYTNEKLNSFIENIEACYEVISVSPKEPPKEPQDRELEK